MRHRTAVLFVLFAAIVTGIAVVAEPATALPENATPASTRLDQAILFLPALAKTSSLAVTPTPTP